jgi:hypothetical protein
MPNLMIRFDCEGSEKRAEEFRSLLLSKGVTKAGVPIVKQGGVILLNLPEVWDHVIDRITWEVRDWCQETGLQLIRSKRSMNGIDFMVILVSDLPPPSTT